MRYLQLIGGVVMAAAQLQGGTTGIAMANNAQSYDALVNFSPGSAEESSLLQLSDMQLAAVVGGAMDTPSQTMRVSSGDLGPGEVKQILTQVLDRLRTNQTMSGTTQSSTTVVEQTGDQNVVVEQVQTSTQSNPPPGDMGSPTSSRQGNTLQQGSHVTVTRQPDGTTRIVTQQGEKTFTIMISLPHSPETLLNSIPFQALVSVRENIMQMINELSRPVIHSPPTAIGRR
jgi:hypothetical protein